MLAENLPEDTVSKLTGLSVSDVTALAKEQLPAGNACKAEDCSTTARLKNALKGKDRRKIRAVFSVYQVGQSER